MLEDLTESSAHPQIERIYTMLQQPSECSRVHYLLLFCEFVQNQNRIGFNLLDYSIDNWHRNQAAVPRMEDGLPRTHFRSSKDGSAVPRQIVSLLIHRHSLPNLPDRLLASELLVLSRLFLE